MSQPNNKPELTSTLHIGLRSIDGISEESPLAKFLKSASVEELETIRGIEGSHEKKAMVIIHRGAAKGSRFLLSDESDHQEFPIGRSPESSIFLDDITVSRKHALIEKSGSEFILKDLGSLNGTYLNDESVHEVQLATGDEIQIGKFHLLFICAKKSHDSLDSTMGEK